MLVLGKPIDVNGVPTFQAKGAESFVLFGARGDARAVLRGLLVQWYVRVAFLVAIALGSVVYAGYLGWPPSAPEPAVPAERP